MQIQYHRRVLDLLFNAHMQPGNGSIGIADATFSIETTLSPFAGVQNGTITVNLRGDLNRNDRIDIFDVGKVAWMASGLIPEDPEADFKGDGRVDGADAAHIAYFYVGKIHDLRRCCNDMIRGCTLSPISYFIHESADALQHLSP